MVLALAKINHQYLLYGVAAAICLLVFVTLILTPAVSAYGRVWEKAAAGFLSLFGLAALVIGGVVIGLLCVFVFAAGGHPWSVTFGYTVWGGKIASALGVDLTQFEFWQWEGPNKALRDSVLSDTSSLTDFGMILGAMAAAAASAPFARNPWPPLKSLAAAALGGLLMGWGARLGFGCNIGAFIGGVASGSLHGWVWFAAALPGCMIGIKLRPLFGLSRE
jgi:hypothetical protein